MGVAKALLTDRDHVPLVVVAVDRLLGAGCNRVTVVLGASAREAAEPLQGAGPAVHVVVADDWAQGMGLSLRRGLADLGDTDATAALITLVDLPDVDERVMRRVVDHWRGAGAAEDLLVRATYGGRPGHPVLVGRAHWEPLESTLSGDVGAQPYLDRHMVLEVDCADLATGRDLDRPEDLG